MSEWYGFDEDEADADTNGTNSNGQQIPVHKQINIGGGGSISPSPLPTPTPTPVVEDIKKLFINKYRHCGTEWDNVAESECSDECMCCEEQVQPYYSEEVM